MLLKLHNIFKKKYRINPDEFWVYHSDEELQFFIDQFWMFNKDKIYHHKKCNLDFSKENIFLKIDTRTILPPNPLFKSKYYKVLHNGICFWASAANFVEMEK